MIQSKTKEWKVKIKNKFFNLIKKFWKKNSKFSKKINLNPKILLKILQINNV